MLGGRVSTKGYYVCIHLLMGVGIASSSGKRIKTLGSKRKDKEPDRSYSNKFLKNACGWRLGSFFKILKNLQNRRSVEISPQCDSSRMVFVLILLAGFDAQVALRGIASSSGKRIKTLGSKRKDKEPDRSYSNKFLSRKHECHFIVLQDRRLLIERKAGLIPDFAPQFGEQLENRNLGRLGTYPAPANIAVVKEFYTNARRLGDHPAEDYLSYIKGHAIRYDPDSINRGMSINIGQVIANEIQVCANTMNTKAPSGYPSLITHLCELARVNISTPPFERPSKAIDEAYDRQYCGGDEAAQPVPPRHPRRRRGPTQGQALSDEGHVYVSYGIQSLHRGQVATVEMIIGMYDTPPEHRWTMHEFNNVVAWPEEQTQGSGVGAAGASTMDNDDEYAFEDVISVKKSCFYTYK
ncbi:hypothetical protein LR48_Vigan05g110700 [Vigna angularis]|uniref:Putative plant transposon protein domain-containing protein n=1 Tax=Phaseolus angularis TaxID=3914 RepID=A0A0L9UL87_PHAAN|nr:hypothetical protein LR48_Vigan05g110700 [Vigna angularis]